MGGGAVVSVEGVEQGLNKQPCGEPVLRLRAVEMWELTVTLWEQSDRKSKIQKQIGLDSPRPSSLDTGLWGRMVLKVEFKSTKSSLTQSPAVPGGTEQYGVVVMASSVDTLVL